MHNQGGTAKGKIKANALLGFERKEQDSDEEDDRKKKRQIGKANFQIKDKEGVDFNFYFSQKYAMIHEKKKRGTEEEGGRGRGRGGRGRGERGRGRGGRGAHREDTRVEGNADAQN